MAEDDYEDYDDYDAACTWCGGEVYVECDDPIQCCARHVGGLCPCSACQGTGLREHQVVF